MKKYLIFFICFLFLFGCSNNKVQKVYSDEEINAAISTNNTLIMEEILKNGVSPNYQFKDGNNLISLALKNNSLDILRVLLKNKADVNMGLGPIKIMGTDKLSPGQTPIYYVKSLEALKLLVNSGSNINDKNTDGTPLLTYFIKYKPIEYSIYLVEKGAYLNIVDREGWTPVFWAGISGNSELLQSMYNKEPLSFAYKDKKGNYPVYYSYSEPNLEIFLQGHYDLNAKNIYGENILGEVYLKAIANGYLDIVKKLINIGVDKNYESYGENGIDTAMEYSSTEVLKYLREIGVKEN